MTPIDYARHMVELARRAGAEQCDVYVRAYDESEVTVRLGETEKLVEAGSKSLGLRVINGGRTAVCSTADLREESLARLAKETVELALISAPDEYAGLPSADDLARPGSDSLQLYDERLGSLTTDEKVRMAKACEAAAFGVDARITNSEGATVTTRSGEVALANSLGFAASYPATAIALMVEVMADDADGKKRNDYWFSSERSMHRLLAPEEVGRIAAKRALAQLGAAKVPTRQVPVVFEPMMAVRLLGDLAACATGGALYRGATFLAGRTGTALAAPLVTIVDDPLEPGRGGSRPFDGEGVASRRTALVEDGIFKAFLFDSYTARRVGSRTTGAAARGVESLPSPAPSNLILQPGSTPPDEIVGSVKDGFFVTAVMGQGFNPSTGDFSRGAAGFWIQDGKLAFPVSEVNISGRLGDMLAGVDAVGDDLTWFGGMAAPTVRVGQMMVSGL